MLVEAETRLGVFEHSIVPVDLNNPKPIHDQILLFVDDLYCEMGYSDFNPEYYYQIDFDKLLEKNKLLLMIICTSR